MGVMEESSSELKVKKARSSGKRIRDIRRLLNNEKFQISNEKKLELEDEIKRLQGVISKNKSSYKKKLDRYLQYKMSKQKTMRFVELVKVKRKINQLQKRLVEALKSQVGGVENSQLNEEGVEAEYGEIDDEIYRIKSELIIYKRYEDYIRLLPFFKDRKYIPLFSNAKLDAEALERREQYINDAQELKEELRMKKVRTSDDRNLSVRDSFLLQEDDSKRYESREDDSKGFKKPIKKIEYRIGDDRRNRPDSGVKKSKDPGRSTNKSSGKQDKDKLNPVGCLKYESEAKTKNNISNHHVIFSDSD